MARWPKVRMPPEWGVEPVPPVHRRLRAFDYFVLWFSLGIGLLVLVAGGILTQTLGLSLAEAALAIGIGSLLGAVMLASAGLIGSRYGIPSMVSLRAVLGRHGSFAPTTLNVLQLVGWASFEVMVMGQAAALIANQPAGSAAAYAFVAVFGAFCALLAIGGPVTVVRQWLEKFAVWLVIASTVWVTYLVFTRGAIPWGGFRSGPAALLVAIDLVIAMPISWWPLVCDYSRFASRERRAFAGTVAGYTVANAWFYLLGAAMIVIVPGTTDVISSILLLSFGFVALFLILVDETDNGFADIYSGAVSLQNVLPRVRQRRFVVGIAVASVALGWLLTAYGGLNGAAAIAYQGFLYAVGGAFVPLLGVLVGDYVLVRRGLYAPGEFSAGPSVRVRAFVAWAAGALVYFYLLMAPGAGLPAPTLGSSLPAFATSLLIQYGLARAAAGRATRAPAAT